MALSLNDLKKTRPGGAPKTAPSHSSSSLETPRMLRPWEQPPIESSNDTVVDSPVSQSTLPTVGTAKREEEKPRTNLGQTEAKVEPKLSQTEAKVEPKLSQTEAKVEPQGPPTEKKVEPELRPQVESKLSQTEAKVEPIQALSALVGLQRNILQYVYESCREAGSKVSAPIGIENLAIDSRTTVSAARKAIQRLEQKGFISRAQYKDGRGGWTQYAIPDSAYNALLFSETRAKAEPKLSQTRAKVRTELEPQLRPNLSSSSSFLELEKLKTTTTETEPKKSDISPLGPDWVDLDYSPLTEIGFTQNHLSQIAKQGNLSATEVQDSVHFFAFDLKRNEKAKEIKGAPINFFMGILRKGIPYAAPENYESPESEARRKYLESKRRLEAEREAQERELQDLEFTEWRRGLSPAELSAIIPEVVRQAPRACESALRTHFDENVWFSRGGASPITIELERAEIRKQIAEALGDTK